MSIYNLNMQKSKTRTLNRILSIYNATLNSTLTICEIILKQTPKLFYHDHSVLYVQTLKHVYVYARRPSPWFARSSASFPILLLFSTTLLMIRTYFVMNLFQSLHFLDFGCFFEPFFLHRTTLVWFWSRFLHGRYKTVVTGDRSQVIVLPIQWVS